MCKPITRQAHRWVVRFSLKMVPRGKYQNVVFTQTKKNVVWFTLKENGLIILNIILDRRQTILITTYQIIFFIDDLI